MQTLALVGLAPLVQGAMRSLRARWEGRPGPAPLQPYRDLAKLWRKEAVLPAGVSPLTEAAPGIVLGVALTFVAALPLLAPNGVEAVVDVVALAFLLALGRFVHALAALDTRSAFAGMAASREVTLGALVEPTLLLALLGAAAVGAGTHLRALLGIPFGTPGALAFVAFFLVTLAETARVPMDNQETHYELTMIHEGLLLEYGGWQLAMLHLAAFVKQAGFLVLAALLLPGSAWWMHAGWAIAVAVAITAVETAYARVRLFEIPQLLATAFVLAATSVALRALGGLG